MALYRYKELNKFHPMYFMNKNIGSQIKLNIKVKSETTNTTPKDPMDVMWSMLRNIRPLPLLFCEIKLIILYKCVHSHYQKE
jgi:hypothetical protein